MTAQTPVYITICEQLSHCKTESATGIFRDKAGIGKSHAAKEFARGHKNTVYIDCSLNKTKQQFVRALAQGFGCESDGRLQEVQADTLYYIKSLQKPLIILDEVADLSYKAFLEIKALYNYLEDYCGWYMLGADGLKAKISRRLQNQKSRLYGDF